MAAFEIAFGPVVVKVNKKSVVMLGPPQGGRRDKHLTVHLTPWDGPANGRKSQHPGAGRYSPHITDLSKPPRERRRFLVRVSPEQVIRSFEGYQRDLCGLWLSATRRVDPSALDEAGWSILPVDPAMLAGFLYFDERRLQICFREELLPGLFERMLEAAVPAARLTEYVDWKHQLTAMRFDTDDNPVEVALLHYLPNGLGNGPGWYATDMEFATSEVLQRLIARHFGPAICRALLRAAEELRLPFEPEAVRALVAQAEALEAEGTLHVPEWPPLEELLTARCAEEDRDGG